MSPAIDYALGLEVDWREQRRAPASASRADRIAIEWPLICRALKCFKPSDDDSKNLALIPPLLDYWRDGDIEYFDVAVPAIFVTADQTINNSNPMAMLPSRLCAAHGAQADQSIFLASTSDLRPQGQARCAELFGNVEVPVRRLALSYFSLPTDLWFDPAKMPASPVQFYLGLLSDGSDAIWDAEENPHACIAGATGSGKTTSAEPVFLQHHLRGGELHLYTAKIGDPVMARFARFPQHTVLAGLRGNTLTEDLEAVRDDLREVRAEVERRQEIRAAHGVDWWRLVPDEHRDAPTKLVVFDESKSFFPVKDRAEEPEIVHLRREIVAEVDNLAQIARQEDVFVIIMTQSPYAETLGTGFIRDQIHLWWTIRKLSANWLSTAYGQSESINPKKLVDGRLPRGRAVVRGVTAPDNPFGDEAVRDGLMQSTRVSDEVREAMLSQAVEVVVAAAEPDPDPDVVVIGLADDLPPLPDLNSDTPQLPAAPPMRVPAATIMTMASIPVIVISLLVLAMITGVLA